MNQALAYYRSVGGADVSVASVQYYQLIRALRMLVFSHRVAGAVHRDARTPIRHAWTGTEVQHLGKHILAYAMGMMPPPDPNYMNELNVSVEQAA